MKLLYITVLLSALSLQAVEVINFSSSTILLYHKGLTYEVRKKIDIHKTPYVIDLNAMRVGTSSSGEPYFMLSRGETYDADVSSLKVESDQRTPGHTMPGEITYSYEVRKYSCDINGLTDTTRVTFVQNGSAIEVHILDKITGQVRMTQMLMSAETVIDDYYPGWTML